MSINLNGERDLNLQPRRALRMPFDLNLMIV